MIWTIVMWIVGLAAVAVVAILIIASAKPDTFRIERRIGINAPPEKVFPLINDFHTWTQWSPWETKDPALKRSYSGATSGKGSVYEWEGNKNVGKGRMEIAESTPSSKVLIALHFLSPFEANNTAEFTLTHGGEATIVNWAMYGPSPFMSKVMSTVMNMDKMVGKDFEQGLANMKAAAER
jgi:uncharacterized protein YndB with AHSA1/START domain